MSTLLILGSTGMIGSGVLDILINMPIKIIECNRSGLKFIPSNESVQFDILSSSLDSLLSEIPGNSYILNLAGVIRHKIRSDTDNVTNEIKLINSDFPIQLVNTAAKYGHRVIQIATDCVFSGALGSYDERSIKDAVDLYGKSKIFGEIEADNLMTIRVSVVGKAKQDHVGLMDWVLNQEFRAEIDGYANHFWNGITTLQFAKVIQGIINTGFVPGTFHLVPFDRMSKYELVRLIAKHGGRNDLKIQESYDMQSIDRTLSTSKEDMNTRLWAEAGYINVPSIEKMVGEYFDGKFIVFGGHD